MKRPSLLLAMLCLCASLAFAQTDYQQYEIVTIKPKLDKMVAFKAAMATHNKKYHNGAGNQASVWSISTGPSSGGYYWVMGPTTYTQLDGRPGKGEHELDWDKNVLPNCESIGEAIYWRLDKEMLYQPAATKNYNKTRSRFYTIKLGQYDRFEAAQKKVIEVYKKKEYKAGYSLYNRQGLSKGPHVFVDLVFEKWSDLDANINFRKDYESVHGEGSWADYLEEMSLATERADVYDELCEMIPELSSNPTPAN